MQIENKLLFGDCMKLMSKIPDKSVEMILTDIPYGEVNEMRKDFGGGYGNLRDLNKGYADDVTFELKDFIKECTRVCYGSIYIFCGYMQISKLIKLLHANKARTRLCIWEKKNPFVINAEKFWMTSIESCVFGRFPNAVFHEHCASCVWRFNIQYNQIHPTQKPLDLFKYLIETSSREGSTILDPCAGSCTTAIAAMITGRKYICMDNNFTAYKTGKLRIEVFKERRQL